MADELRRRFDQRSERAARAPNREAIIEKGRPSRLAIASLVAAAIQAAAFVLLFTNTTIRTDHIGEDTGFIGRCLVIAFLALVAQLVLALAAAFSPNPRGSLVGAAKSAALFAVFVAPLLLVLGTISTMTGM